MEKTAVTFRASLFARCTEGDTVTWRILSAGRRVEAGRGDVRRIGTKRNIRWCWGWRKHGCYLHGVDASVRPSSCTLSVRNTVLYELWRSQSASPCRTKTNVQSILFKTYTLSESQNYLLSEGKGVRKWPNKEIVTKQTPQICCMGHQGRINNSSVKCKGYTFVCSSIKFIRHMVKYYNSLSRTTRCASDNDTPVS
jgi:hypothetical protein